jgi:signal transduction histidine kinase
MLLLPPIRWSQQNLHATLQLPCPSSDWIGLIAGQDETLELVLRSNPAVFLTACVEYHASVGDAASDWQSLLPWCKADLVSRIVERMMSDAFPVVVQKVFNPTATSMAAAAWMKSKGGNKLRKHLVRFAAFASGHSSDHLKSSVPDWLPEDMQLPKFRKLDSRGTAQRERIANRWLVDERPVESMQVSELLRLKAQTNESDQRFAERLQQEKLESMKQLAYGASHEINNPLANIASRAQTMIPTEPDLNRRQKLATIYEQAMRAHEMISDMMLFANPPQLHIRQTELRLLIPSVIRDVETSLARQQQFRAKRIDFSVTLGPDLKPVEIDPGQFAVLLHSLIKNSMEAIETEGTIELEVRQREGEELQFSVTDDGVGVSELAKRHLFDPFYSGREAGRGLGFGLSKAWRIAQLHGADLSLDESHSPGARFVVTLPLGRKLASRHNKRAEESTVRPAAQKPHAA